MVLASMRAVRLFLRARAVMRYVLRAASTLKNADGEQRALRNSNSNTLHDFMSPDYFLSAPVSRKIVTCVSFS